MTRPKRFKFRSIYLWHRYTGLCCALLVLVLSVTGMLLQHADALNLPHKYLQNKWLLEWYGISAEPVTSYKIANHWISQAGTSLYLDEQPLKGEYGQLKGAVATEFGLIVVQGSELTLFTHDGSLIESLSADNGLPEPIQAITISDGDIIVQGTQRRWKADRSFLSWQIFQVPVASWVQPATAPFELIETVQNNNRERQINWERVLLDLHSGRLFGRLGPWLMDAAAIGLILLSSSGLWVWAQRRHKNKHHARDLPDNK
jgi:hypothetical protein